MTWGTCRAVAARLMGPSPYLWVTERGVFDFDEKATVLTVQGVKASTVSMYDPPSPRFKSIKFRPLERIH